MRVQLNKPVKNVEILWKRFERVMHGARVQTVMKVA
jgi:hypothetical protein